MKIKGYMFDRNLSELDSIDYGEDYFFVEKIKSKKGLSWN